MTKSFKTVFETVCVRLNGSGLSCNQLLLTAKHELQKGFKKKSMHQKIEGYYYSEKERKWGNWLILQLFFTFFWMQAQNCQ